MVGGGGEQGVSGSSASSSNVNLLALGGVG